MTGSLLRGQVEERQKMEVSRRIGSFAAGMDFEVGGSCI